MMNYNLRLIALLSLFPLSVFAQETQDTEDTEEIVELSPFIVESGSDVGYLATNTLAGTRLKTQLNEVGSAISIITKEFMDDTGATDAETLLGYTVNAEVGGSQGNFAGGIVSGEADQVSTRTNPQYNQRIRGLSAALLTRDYFRTDIPFDRYNTSRVTLNRGPNSILFGIGNAGGVVNNGTAQAMMEDLPIEVSVRIGEHNSHRETLEINRVVVKDRLAIRFHALNDEEFFDQKPAFEQDRRLYFALTGVLREGERGAFLGRTTARFNYEAGSLEANPVSPVPPSNSFQDWFTLDHGLPTPEQIAAREAELGTTLNAGQVRDLYYDLYAVRLDARVNAGWAYAPKSVIEANVGWTGKINLGYPYFRELGVFFQNDGSDAPGIGIPNSSLQGGQGSTRHQPNIPFRGSFLGTRSIFSEDFFVGDWTVPVITDPAVFDNENVLFTGDTNRIYRDFTAHNFKLEQILWDGRMGLEFVWDRQTFERETFLPFAGGGGGGQNIFVDVNSSLNNSTDLGAGRVANPNVGRPLVQANYMPTNYSDTERETLRATAFMTLDAKDYLGDTLGTILGNHTLTGVYAEETVDLRSRSEFLYWEGNFPAGSPYVSGASYASDGSGTNSWGRRYIPLVYVGDSMMGDEYQSASDARIRPINFRIPQDGDVYRMFYRDNATDLVQEGDFRLTEIVAGGDLAKNVIESYSGSLHSRFLDEHLITIVGFRYDKLKIRNRFDYDTDGDDTTFNNLLDPEVGTYSGPFDLDAMRLTDAAEVFGDQSVAYSAVLRFPEAYLFDLPLDSDLSIFYNFSDSFNPISRRTNVFGETLAPPSSETKEYGFMLELLNNKFSIRANWFETSEFGATLPGSRQTQARGAVDNSVKWIGDWIRRIRSAEASGRVFYDPAAPLDPEDGSPTDALTRMYTIWQAQEGTEDPLVIVNIPDGADPRNFQIRDAEGNLQPYQVNSYDDMYALIAALHPEPLRSTAQFAFDRDNNEVVYNTDINDRVGTFDSTAEGFEIEMVGNLFRGFRVTANVGMQETTLTNIAPAVRSLTDQTWQNLQDYGLVDLRDEPNGAGSNTYRSRYTRLVRVPLDAAQAQEGQISQEQRKWRFNMVANYTFFGSDNPLRGLGVGGAFRWEDKIAVGYPQELVWANPFDDNTLINQDAIDLLPADQAADVLAGDSNLVPVLSDPFFDGSVWSGDVWISYRKKFESGLDWRINLSVRNAFGDDEPRVLRRNPDGEVAVIRNAAPTTVWLTNTFRF